jgi:hypothetical protein
MELIVAFRNFANALKNSSLCLVKWPLEDYERQIRSQGLLHILNTLCFKTFIYSPVLRFAVLGVAKNIGEVAPQKSVTNSTFIQQVFSHIRLPLIQVLLLQFEIIRLSCVGEI